MATFPTGPGLLPPTILALLAQQGGGGGGDVDMSGYVTTDALTAALANRPTTAEVTAAIEGATAGTGSTDAEIQGFIRGNGLFRPIVRAYGPTEDMTDMHWQCFVSTPYLSGDAVTVQVHLPTGTLTDATTNYVSPGTFGTTAPSGIWTLIVNPNNTATVRIKFPDVISNIVGKNADGSYLSGSTNAEFTLGQGHMAFLMYLGTNMYYLCIL